jgi:hypothetical protein
VFFGLARGDPQRERIFGGGARNFLIFETFPLTRNGSGLESGTKWDEVVDGGKKIRGSAGIRQQ